MPGCVLRITGPAGPLTAAVANAFVSFTEARASERARQREVTDRATFLHTVSDAPGSEVPRQIAEAEAFVRAHGEALAKLVASAGVESAALDFGCEVEHDSCGICLRWPRSLLEECSRAGLELDLSIYVVESQDTA